MATIKRIANITTPEASAAFFNVHLRALREFSLQAIQQTIDYFCFEDEREPQHKPFFPQPDEIIKIAQRETELIIWRKEQAEKIFHNTARAMGEQKEIQKPLEKSIWDELTKEQVVKAARLVRQGFSPQKAKYEVLKEIND